MVPALHPPFAVWNVAEPYHHSLSAPEKWVKGLSHQATALFWTDILFTNFHI